MAHERRHVLQLELLLDVAAVHVDRLRAEVQLRRDVARALALAEQLASPCIWGEATESSHSWYEDHLAIETVRDHFFIEDDVMQHCRNEMHRAQQEMLARRTTT